MKKNFLFAALLLAIVFTGCRPKPIDIDIPQQRPVLAVSSACYDEHTVFVAVGYTISSLKSVADTARQKGIAGMVNGSLVDSALVTLTTPGGTIDTLQKMNTGLYGRRDLQLQPGTRYTLLVKDLRTGTEATAATTFLVKPLLAELRPEVVRAKGDTSVRIYLQLGGAAPGSHYFVCYNTLREAKMPFAKASLSLQSLASYAPKRIELLDGGTARNGLLERTATLADVRATDTVIVQIAQMDEAYYRYLDAYKRMGTLFNQVTGEPINLPTNIVTGQGYFSLAQPQSELYDLRRY